MAAGSNPWAVRDSAPPGKEQVAQTAVRLGVSGLGRAFVLTEPALRDNARIKLVAACEPRDASRDAFARAYPDARVYSSFDAMCDDSNVQAIYIATPHEWHADQACQAAAAGKHLLIDKPMAVDLTDARKIVDAVSRAGVVAVVGPSHSFDAPVTLANNLVASGRYGRVRMVQMLNYTDFLYRPRRTEELETARGGGVLFSQAVHQVDVLRRLVPGQAASSVVAQTGNWDATRDTEGAYTAMVWFDGGAVASLTYSGYARFDSDAWMDNLSETGHDKQPGQFARTRQALVADGVADEGALKVQRTYGLAPALPMPSAHEHFGPVIVSLDGADLRLTPRGVVVYADDGESFVPCMVSAHPRTPVLDVLADAIHGVSAPLQDPHWGMGSLEICHAILRSSRGRVRVDLVHQRAAPYRPRDHDQQSGD